MQYFVGYCYYAGADGVQEDLTQAERWFAKAAEQGLPEAEYMQGILRFDSDYPTALQWMNKAAKKNHPEALYFMFKEYCSGVSCD